MRRSLPILLVIGVAVLGASCAPKSALITPGAEMPVPPGESYDPPGSTITTGREIDDQIRRTLTSGSGVSVSNEYPGARLSAFEQTGEDRFRVFIRPENAPINHSPWYGFTILADTPRSVRLQLAYENEVHRYVPKLSRDGVTWTPIAAGDYMHDEGNGTALLRLDVGPEPLWVSAQERMTSSWYDSWLDGLASRDGVVRRVAGRSVRDRPIPMIEFGGGDRPDGIVGILSRQHPPEITGALGMVRFVETLLGDTDLARAFRERYRTIVIPIVNPDGVDEGHWRHNAAGVDLNRDWMSFNQPEVRVVRDTFVGEAARLDAPVVFAIDFHSTQEDVFYTHLPEMVTNRPALVNRWLQGIAEAVPGYTINEEASGYAAIDTPTSKNWFFREFKATSVTYEVGDEQDRALLDRIATAGAEVMMQQLLVGGNGH